MEPEIDADQQPQPANTYAVSIGSKKCEFAKMTTSENTWLLSNSDFPKNADLDDQIRFLLGYATLAPSSHNTQPWRFGIGPDGLDIHADRTRALPVVDPDDRELVISCGAALGVFEVAARFFALKPDVTLLPDPENPDHLARVSVSKGAPASDKERALFNAIPDRRTDRSSYALEDLPPDLEVACQETVQALGTQLRFFAGGQEAETIADLVAEGDRIQFEDPGFRRELASWVRSDTGGIGDGLAGSGFGMPDFLAPATRFVIRTFDLGKNVAASDREKILSGSPALALLSSDGDDVKDWLNTGRALAMLLLVLTSRGYTASYLNQPIEIGALRQKLRNMSGFGSPQILLRIGKSGNSPAPSARRELSDVLVTP